MMARVRACSGAVLAIIVALVPTLTFATAAHAQTLPNIEVVEQTAYVHRGEAASITLKITDAAPTDRVSIAVGRTNASRARVRQTRADLRG